jgi:L-fucose mutarotase
MSMLQGISALVSPDLLHLLASMGHGDEVALVDANYPAASTASRNGGRLVTCLGVNTSTLLRAILPLFPLDTAVTEPAVVMEPVQEQKANFPNGLPEAAGEIIRLIEDHKFKCGKLDRFAFYERANGAFGVVRVGELRVYGNVILKKGVVKATN